jgi:energy-converting hydrogenase Eha subunit C
MQSTETMADAPRPRLFDRAIKNVLIGKGWAILSGPATVFMVAHFLSATEQGYFYTFASIQGLQIFFELGLELVVMQFASHEMKDLEWHDNGTVQGEAKAKERLASLLRFLLKWYGLASILALVFLIVVGWKFFAGASSVDPQIQWKAPWILLAVGTSLTLSATPIYGLIEGCGRVAEIAGVRAIQGIASSVLLWVMLGSGGRLYAVGALSLIPFTVAAWFFVSKYAAFLSDLWKTTPEKHNVISWKSEIWPMQWRISLSWISGYLIFQLANPVLFHYHGSVVSGQYGMSLRLVDSLQGLAYAWVSTKASFFGRMIAAKEGMQLKKLFYLSSVRAVSVFALLSAGLICGVVMAKWLGLAIAGRFLELPLVLLMCMNGALNCIVFSIATLVRAEKKEPFLWLSLGIACLTAAFVWLGGIPFGPVGVLLPSFIAGLSITLPVSLRILREFSKQYFVPATAAANDER